jgi:hypothetical protein
MGFRISWLAAKGLSKSALFAHFGLHDTGVVDEANESPFSVAELPTGWTVLWSNDQKFANIERATELSRLAPVISCMVNETVMFSSANYFEDGTYKWFVGHNAQEGMFDLQIEGDLPSQFEDIRTSLMQQQDSEGGDAADVDFIFDIPLELARTVCGFKHDMTQFDWGEPEFFEAKPIEQTTQGMTAKPPGLFSRLFGRL